MKHNQIERMDVARLLFRKGAIEEKELNAAMLWQFAMDGAVLKSHVVKSWGVPVFLQNHKQGTLDNKQMRCMEIRKRWFRALGKQKGDFLDYCLAPDMCREKIRAHFKGEAHYVFDVHIAALIKEMATIRFGPRRAFVRKHEEQFLLAA